MKRRLIRGRDWNGWAWKHTGETVGDIRKGSLFYWAEPEKPRRKKPTESGRWVRVKFTEARPS